MGKVRAIYVPTIIILTGACAMAIQDLAAVQDFYIPLAIGGVAVGVWLLAAAVNEIRK
jgi:dipeptide/tripeptide permease